MQYTVVETRTFLDDVAAAGLSAADVDHIVEQISLNPHAGVLMANTGGARKRRFGAHGKGKSGGVRVVSYFAAEDVPVFLLALINKAEKDNLSKAECNALRSELAEIANDYRAGQRLKIAAMRKGARQ
jgi:hypothetical protein